jgi:hypothetical protein
MAQSPLEQELVAAILAGDTPRTRTILDIYGLLDYQRAHDVRMSGVHLACPDGGKDCPPYQHLDGTEGA